MSKFKHFALVSVLGLIGYVSSGLAAASQPTIQLITEPPPEQLLPASQPAKLTVQAVDNSGKPVQDAKIRLQIFTPSKTPWFSSDFPIVEGTQLLDLQATTPTGKLQVQQVLPIRGKYQLRVEVQPLEGQKFTPTQQTLILSVPEKGVKYYNFGILAAILLSAGLTGGWVIGGKQPFQPGEIAPQRVRLLLSGVTVVAIVVLLGVNISAEFAESHSHHHHPQLSHTDVQPSPILAAKWSGDVHATVGKLAQMAIQLSDSKTGKPATDAVVNVKVIQSQHNETVFVYQGTPDSSGKFIWQQQFFDAATHQVVVEVSPQPGSVVQFAPFGLSKEIEVEAVAPPLSVRLITLTYLITILVVGLLLGLWIRRKALSESFS